MYVPSIFEAAAELEDVMLAVDDCTDEELSQALIARFKAANKNTQLAVDLRQQWADRIKGYRHIVKLRQAQLKKDSKRLERMEEALKASMKALMETHPKLTFRSSTGKKVYLQAASTPAMKFTLNLAKKTVTNIFDDRDLERIPSKYWKLVAFKVLDCDEIRKDLEKGECRVDWAKLDDAKTIRGL
jgi:hypothetical protein